MEDIKQVITVLPEGMDVVLNVIKPEPSENKQENTDEKESEE